MTVRGWCPSLYEPMESGDGWLVRVKPSIATLSADAALALADAAERFGSGVIELTNRANMQFRGLSVASARLFAESVAGLGLASSAPGAERRRNVLVSPLAGCDPSVAGGTVVLARALEVMLVDDETLSTLPAKFGLIVDGGGLLGVTDAPGDILVQLRGGQARVSLDGTLLAAGCMPDEVVDTVRRLIGVFLDNRVARRMRELVPEDAFAAAGLKANLQRLPSRPRQPVGQHSYGANSIGAFGFGLAFGQIDAASLRVLAIMARDQGNGSLRVTPWRTLMLPSISPATAVGALSAAIIGDPADPRLSIHACAGKPACPHSSVDTRMDAEQLALSGVAQGRIVHVSGCSKGCAHPGPCAITLVGEAGRYRLVRGGRADAPTSRSARPFNDVLAELSTEDPS